MPRSRSFLVLVLAAVFAATSLIYTSVTSRPSSAEPVPLDTVRLTPVDDAFGTSRQPNHRTGSGDHLVARQAGDIRKTSYLKFRITPRQLAGGTIERAFLAVHLKRELNFPVAVRTVGRNNWDERRLTYRTAPSPGASLGRMAPGAGPVRWVSVTDWLRGPGTYSFALTAARGIARFASSESSRPPTLVLKIKRAPKSSPAPSPSSSPTATPDPTTSTPTVTPDPTTSTPTATPGPTGDTSCRVRFPGDPCAGGMYYGASVEGGNPGTLEAQVGQHLTLFRSYMSASSPASKFVTRATADLAAGRMPLISTKVPGSWADVAAGKYDTWLLERIKGLAAVPGPVWLSLHHEPRGDGPAADWVAMQQHARTLIDRYAPNIALVGILNGWDFLQKGGNPGAYNHPVGTGVDVMGFDTYNPWSPTNGSEWKSVQTAMSPGDVIMSWGYPTLVAESGVRTDPDHPGRAAQWLADFYDYGLSHGFVGLSYFDSGANSPDGTWQLSGERLTQFAANLRRSSTVTFTG